MSGSQLSTDAVPTPPGAGTTPAVRHDDDAAAASDAVAAAVLAVPGVADLHSGTYGEVATYLAGRRVNGVRLRPDGSAEVHVVLLFGVPVLGTADLVRRAVQAVRAGPVDVSVQDVVAARTAPQATGETGGPS